MSTEGYNIRTIGNLIRQIAGTYNNIPVKYIDVNIDEVLEDERCCIVSSCDGSMAIDGLKVRYMPEISDGDEEVPLQDSTAVIVFTEITEPIIVSKSWLSRKTVIIGNQSWEINSEKQVFNDGKFGGIPIVKDPNNSQAGLLKKINQLEQKYNELLTACKSVVITLAPSGVFPTASFYTSNTPIAPITKESDISNPNITHGKTLPDA